MAGHRVSGTSCPALRNVLIKDRSHRLIALPKINVTHQKLHEQFPRAASIHLLEKW